MDKPTTKISKAYYKTYFSHIKSISQVLEQISQTLKYNREKNFINFYLQRSLILFADTKSVSHKHIMQLEIVSK